MGYPRTSVDLSGYPDLCVIYLGYRVRNLRGLASLMRMGSGLSEIQRNKPPGLLAHESMMFGFNHPGFRQYWQDLDSLEAFTRGAMHKGWWAGFAKEAANGGIWHETYRLRGGMEAIYSGMPKIGFAAFAPERAPVGMLASARQRIG